MLLPVLAASLLVSAGDPPVRIKLSDDVFIRGERARVRVKAMQDGYLLVLRADAAGRVRILFPLDPADSGTVRRGKELEVRGRHDREAFVIDDREGSGRVFAAVSSAPFKFEDFTRNGHWDFSALVLRDSVSDPEAGLLDLVDRMSDGHYEYDLVTYTVSNRLPYRRYAGMGGWGGWGGWGGLGGWGWGGGRWYDPFYSCFRCRPFYGPRIIVRTWR